jgi:Response regulator containing CheY-like receiver, AAA-type ATPase, and DNA-binding domains
MFARRYVPHDRIPSVLMFGRSRSVLIVEDDGDLRRALAELLEDEGYQCLHANNGIEALTGLKIQRADLLIADLLMPLMNGVDLLARLRQDLSYATYRSSR